jgi:mitogen-activated protein kinase organizer 1
MTLPSNCGISGAFTVVQSCLHAFHTLGGRSLSSQNRQPIQILEEARDSVQALYVGSSRIMSGSVDGHVRTYDLRKGELRADYIGRTCATEHYIFRNTAIFFCADPVTSVVPTQDESTYLVMTLDGHIRLMDAITGKLLNDFTGHVHTSYRCRTCFGHGEASVIAGDEDGAIWAWDLLDVSSLTFMHTSDI